MYTRRPKNSADMSDIHCIGGSCVVTILKRPSFFKAGGSDGRSRVGYNHACEVSLLRTIPVWSAPRGSSTICSSPSVNAREAPAPDCDGANAPLSSTVQDHHAGRPRQGQVSQGLLRLRVCQLVKGSTQMASRVPPPLRRKLLRSVPSDSSIPSVLLLFCSRYMSRICPNSMSILHTIVAFSKIRF